MISMAPLEALMGHLAVGDLAPDFTLRDFRGADFTFSELLTSQNALLVFNLGFV